jgi:phosphoglycolate phosphatase
MNGKLSVLWDWNGTLLDDMDVCIDSINVLLGKRKLPLLNREKYRSVFTFPVKDYYRLVGFDFEKEDYEPVAMGFIHEYRKRIVDCKLFPDVKHALNEIQSLGYKQYIVSAMEQSFLLETIERAGIKHYFNGIAGITDHLANGKAGMAEAFLNSQNINPEDTWLLGDTLHDSEVATQLGLNCILVADGHQSADRLMLSGCKVVSNIGHALDCIKSRCLEINS